MNPLLNSFWRAAAYCLIPRVMALSLLPLLLMGIIAAVGGYFFWTPAVAWVQSVIENPAWLGMLWNWLGGLGMGNVPGVLAPLMLILGVAPLIVIGCLLAVAMLMTPAMVTLVARRRFADLERKHGGSFIASTLWSLGASIAALLALLVSMPLWLAPLLALVLPPLIWGWLTYRIMAFDALAEHASKAERQMLFKRHQNSFLFMGIISGLLGAAPAVVWASGTVFAAAFIVLIPVAIWIYTLIFVFSSLWFVHYCLAALQQLRLEQSVVMPHSVPPSASALESMPPSTALP